MFTLIRLKKTAYNISSKSLCICISISYSILLNIFIRFFFVPVAVSCVFQNRSHEWIFEVKIIEVSKDIDFVFWMSDYQFILLWSGYCLCLLKYYKIYFIMNTYLMYKRLMWLKISKMYEKKIF